MDFMKRYPDNFFDLAIVDPEYGRNEDGGTNRSKWVVQNNGNKLYVSTNVHKKKNWDNKPANEEYFNELFRVSKNQIIWGANYYNCNFGSGRIIWDKCNDGTDQSDAEIAFNSLTERVDMFRFMWRGMMQGKSIKEGTIQQGNKALNEKIIHPTQKPTPLYMWLLINYGKKYNLILDTHLGSGSSRIAAYKLGFDFYSCELDKDYFEAQEKRFKEAIAQPLFDNQPLISSTQTELFG
jgi:site-specific DNA-methyltransferase (adenine-specific)